MDNQTANKPRAIATWLYSCAFMVFCMILIGAITRLTESGLSITEWKPLIGAIPPLNAQEWAHAFELYKASPEYIHKNGWMELSDFKSIYFWEWLHRLWGRLIGLVFALPLLFFWVRGMIPQGYKSKLLGLLILGGAQGFMGWYMVMSGLVDIPAVSHFRLAAHLGLALIILVCLLLCAFSLTDLKKHPSKPLYIHGLAIFMLLAITICWGAFTAGLDAGLVYNESFPKMGGQWIPPDFWAKESWLENILTHHSAVQFTHRWLAITTLMGAATLWLHGFARNEVTPVLTTLMFIVILQFGLGIATLLSGIHIHAAVTHQAGAVILLSALTLFMYQSRP